MIRGRRYVYGIPVSSPPVSGMSIGTNFWHYTYYSGEEPMIPLEEIDWDTAYANGDNIWNPTWLEEVSIYSTFRFMNWAGTNNNAWGLDEDWDNRRAVTSDTNHHSHIPSYIGFFNHGSNRPGLAYEWMIDLCNRTNADMWMCVRHRSREYYWENLAHLLAANLNPGLKVYIEYSNETWNGIFDQYDYVKDAGTDAGMPGSNEWYVGQSFHVHMSFELFEVFQDVFAQYGRSVDLVRVIATGGNVDLLHRALGGVSSSGSHYTTEELETINPRGQWFDALAEAPYVGSGLDGASPTIYEDSQQGLLDQVTSTGRVTRARARADEYGVDLIAYEGGMHQLLNAREWAENPLVYDHYVTMFDTYKDYFDGPFCHYAHTSEWLNDSGRGAWGTMEYTGMPIDEAHKYRAIRDWVTDNV